MTKVCLIDERYTGFGDIVIYSSIAKYLVDSGYVVHWPVNDPYHYSLVKKYICIDNLIWHSVQDSTEQELNEIPYFKSLYDERPIEERTSIKFPNGDLYLSFEDCQRGYSIMVMANRLFWARDYLGMEFGWWRDSVPINRFPDREKLLIDTYNLHGDYILVNNTHSYNQKINVKISNKDTKNIFYIDHTTDWSHKFNPFDWILALQNAKEVHAVNSLIAILADKYCEENKIYLYNRNHSDIWHYDAAFIWRNPKWILM
jgi:hypothetical protein